MMTTATGLVLIVVIFAVGLFLARRILRLAIKLAFVGAILFALFGAGVLGWWQGWFTSLADKSQRPVTTNPAHNANRRPPR